MNVILLCVHAFMCLCVCMEREGGGREGGRKMVYIPSE